MLAVIHGDAKLFTSWYKGKNMKEIKIPDKVKEQMQGLLIQKAFIESNIRMYMQGFMDSQVLKGDWNLDTNKWVLVKMPIGKEDK